MIKKLTNFKYFNLCIDVIFIAIAMFISFYARKNFIDFSAIVKYYFFDGERILTTNDAYHFATATKDLIEGHIKDGFYPIASLELPAIFTSVLYYILPFSLDELLFLMPAFMAGFLAIPIYFFTKDITNKYVALFAAILAPLASSYSDRTVAGYYDTDMLILTLPMCGLYFLYKILKSYNLRDLILCVIFFTLSLLWHKVSATYILTAGVFIAIAYIFIVNRKNTKLLEVIGVLLVCISYFNIIAKIIIIAILLHFMVDKTLLFSSITNKIKAELKYKSLIIMLIGVAVFLVANQDLIISRLSLYIVRDTAVTNSITLKNTYGTIMELAPLSLSSLTEHTIGDKAVFIAGLIGICIMFYKQPKTIIVLPMLLLSLSSLKFGLRFSMFGATIFSMGFFYLVYFVTNQLNRFINDKYMLNMTKAAILLVFGFFAISPNYYHTKAFVIPPVANSEEINALKSIKEDSTNRNDITISSFDYGFMIPYYSNTRPIISGIDLDGINHFLSSFVLTNSNQRAAYNMAKLISQALDMPINDSLIDKNLIDRILYKYNAQDDPQTFMDSLKNPNLKIDTPDNIYIYLPISIIAIQTAIDEFSDIDYKSGQNLHKAEDKTLAQFSSIQKNKDINEAENNDDMQSIFTLDNELTFFADSGILKNNEGKTKQMQAFHIVERKNGVLTTTSKIYTTDKTELHMIYSKDLDMFFAIDDRTNQSLIVQFFIYENYDKNLFSLIYTSKSSKAYKLK